MRDCLVIPKLLKDQVSQNLYCSRILNLGIYVIFSNSTDFKKKDDSDKNKIISNTFESLSLSASKAEKDIGIYESSLKKLEQAKELIDELKTKNKKKFTKTNPQILAIENQLIEILGTKVCLKTGKNGGSIEISYYSDDDLERNIELIESIST